MPRPLPLALTFALTLPAFAQIHPVAPITASLIPSMLEPKIVHNPARDVVPISSAEGLADFTVRVARGAMTKVSIVVRTINPDGSPTDRSYLMRRSDEESLAENSFDTYRIRLKANTSKIRYNFLVQNDDLQYEFNWTEITLAPTPATPDWAKGAVWYQIFPERFRNAVPENDPKGPSVFLADWHCNWYDIQEGELDAWMTRRNIDDASKIRARAGGPLYNVIFDRRYGGDLQGIVEKMDELKDLGVTALYLNPIFEAESLHKYDASDYRHIDERLAKPASAGPSRAQDGKYTPPKSESGLVETDDPKTWQWTAADKYFVDVFLPEAKKRGLRVILDGVWNHTGKQFWAFQDLVQNGQKSAYKDWYISDFDNEGKLVSWSGWPGRKNGDLPEFRQVKGGLTPDAQTAIERGDLNIGVKHHIFDITKRWMDPNGDGDPCDGIDGWRVDVAGEIGEQFWRDWRKHVKSINPNAIIIAEIWGKVDGLGAGSGFDTQMNYPFAYPILNWLTNTTPRTDWSKEPEPFTSDQLVAALDKAFKDAPQTNLIAQNLFASHDTPRYVSMLQNPGREYDRDCTIQNGDGAPREKDPHYIPFKESLPDDEAYKRSILGVAIQATYLGSPMIYYGDEWGMWGADDPNDRKPVPWTDVGDGKNKNTDDKLIPEVHVQYRKWLRMRTDPETADILRYGDVQHLDSGSPDVFAFVRSLNDKAVVVVINRGATKFDVAPLLDKLVSQKVEQDLLAPLSAKSWTFAREIPSRRPRRD